MLEQAQLLYEAFVYVMVGAILLFLAIPVFILAIISLMIYYQKSSDAYFSKIPYEKGKNYKRVTRELS